jgi:hypothetical protein
MVYNAVRRLSYSHSSTYPSEDENELSTDALALFSDPDNDVNHDGNGEEEADEPRLSTTATGKRRALSQGHMPSKRDHSILPTLYYFTQILHE